jgi:hypothetical protein
MLTRWSLSLMAMGLILVGCVPQTPYRAGHDATEVVAADPRLCPELHAASQFRIPVAYVEIDEQGYFQDRSQMERALALVAAAGKPKYVVVFVHGWFHSARPDDGERRGDSNPCSPVRVDAWAVEWPVSSSGYQLVAQGY